MVARSRVLELEEEVRLLTDQKESLGQELSAVTTQLEKEKAKVESMLRHREVRLLLPGAAQLQPQPLITAVPLPRGSSAGARAAESCCSPCRLSSPCSPCRPSRTPCCSSWTAWTRSVRSCKPAWGRLRGTGPGWWSSWRRAGSSGSRAGTSSGRSRYPAHGGEHLATLLRRVLTKLSPLPLLCPPGAAGHAAAGEAEPGAVRLRAA